MSPRFLFIIPFLLLSISTWTLSSLENNLAWGDFSTWVSARAVRQIIFALLAVVVAYILVYIIKVQKNLKFIFWFNILVSFVNILVIIISHEVRGASRWLKIGGFSLQPSELLKVGLILWVSFFAAFKDLSKPINLLWYWSFPLLSFFTIWDPSFGQSDLGTALIVILPAVVIFMVQPSVSKWLKSGFIGLIILGIIGIGFNLAGYQKQRLSVLNFITKSQSWTPSSSDDINQVCNQTDLYNTCQSISLIANNQLFGSLESFQTSRTLFLPERQTDFIFASISHYLGILGSSAVIILYLILFMILGRLLSVARDYQFYLILAGILSLLAQTVVNISMNLGLLPVVGVPLPWLSYGGSHLLGSFILLALMTTIEKSKFEG
jgi:cell division protein FtsW (lipid II flippase)